MSKRTAGSPVSLEYRPSLAEADRWLDGILSECPRGGDHSWQVASRPGVFEGKIYRVRSTCRDCLATIEIAT